MVLDLLLIVGFFLVLGRAEVVDLFSIVALLTVLRYILIFFSCWWSLVNAAIEVQGYFKTTLRADNAEGPLYIVKSLYFISIIDYSLLILASVSNTLFSNHQSTEKIDYFLLKIDLSLF